MGKAPAQRYGVAAATGVAKAQLLILPDYGESAETWFETVRDLTGAGYTVWVLEGVGQGGSGRLTSHRDLGEAKSFDTDVAAVHAMLDLAIRPTAQRPLVLMGQGVGALVAARAVETGAAPSSLILSAPDCRHGLAPGALVLLRLGSLRAPGADRWRRDGPDDRAAHRTHDAFRGAVTHAWQFANPDLRLGGPTLDYAAALDRLQRLTAGDTARLKATPTLVIQPAGARACLAPPLAQVVTLPGAFPALELESDATRAAWLATIQHFAAQTAARTHPTPGFAPQ